MVKKYVPLNLTAFLAVTLKGDFTLSQEITSNRTMVSDDVNINGDAQIYDNGSLPLTLQNNNITEGQKLFFRKEIEDSLNGNYKSDLDNIDKWMNFPEEKSANDYFGRGISYYKIGNYYGALADLSQTISLNNTSYPNAYYLRADIYSKLNKNKEAIDDITMGMALRNSSNPNDYVKRAELYSKIGEYDEAVGDYTQAILYRDFSVPEDYYWRGVAYGKLGKHQEAINDFSQAISLSTASDPLYYNWRGAAYEKLGNHHAAVDDLSQAISLRTAPESSDYYWRGAAYENLGNHHAAVDDLSQAISFRTTPDPNDYHLRGKSYNNLGKYQEAIDDLSQAISFRTTPDQYDYYWRGISYAKLDRHQEAIDDFSQVISLHTSPNPNYYDWRASSYEKLGKYQEAISDYTKAIEFTKNDDVLKGTLYDNRANAHLESLNFYRFLEDSLHAPKFRILGAGCMAAIALAGVAGVVGVAIVRQALQVRQQEMERQLIQELLEGELPPEQLQQLPQEVQAARTAEPFKVRSIILAFQEEIDNLITTHPIKDHLKQLFKTIFEKQSFDGKSVKEYLEQILPKNSNEKIETLVTSLNEVYDVTNGLTAFYRTSSAAELRQMAKNSLDEYIDSNNTGKTINDLNKKDAMLVQLSERSNITKPKGWRHVLDKFPAVALER